MTVLADERHEHDGAEIAPLQGRAVALDEREGLVVAWADRDHQPSARRIELVESGCGTVGPPAVTTMER